MSVTFLASASVRAVVASGHGHRGPVYFFVMGGGLTALFAPCVVAPNGLRRLNTWLAKSRVIRAIARARSGTDGTEQYASDARIRVVSAVATLAGLGFLVVGIVELSR